MCVCVCGGGGGGGWQDIVPRGLAYSSLKLFLKIFFKQVY